MIDINKIREDYQKVEKDLRKKINTISLEEVKDWDIEKRKIGIERDALKNRKNVVSKEIPMLK